MQHRSKFICRFYLFVFVVLGLQLLCISNLAYAQITSTITGTITDKQGGAIAGAQVRVEGKTVAGERTATTDANGVYTLAALPAGTYDLTVSGNGFRTGIYKDLEVTLNRTLRYDVTLEVGSAREQIQVSGEAPLLETQSSEQSTTIMPRDITDIPINGRNYLDLMQMVPGVQINRAADAGTDTATPVLGERGNNTNFLIDGLWNENEVNGGAAAQFNQETIAEFQVITTGYTADFGHASGGIVNVITRSGTNDVHGVASVFHRNNVFDTSDTSADVPKLLRWDYSLALGGPLIKDKVFWFVSGEGIHENRQLNFTIPSSTPDVIRKQEEQYGSPATDREARAFGKFDENLGKHHLTEEFNYTNAHIGNFLPLSQSTSLPSTRQNFGSRSLLIGGADNATLGDSGSPWILNIHGEYRRDPSSQGPAHPQAGPDTIFNLFSSYTTGGIFGDIQPQINYGSITTPSNLDQLYGIFGASVAKTIARHTLKFGWDFERTQVDGNESSLQQDQLFATLPDYEEFGPINAGFFLLYTIGGETPAASKIHLRNNYTGLYAMDDWKVNRKLTLNYGLRWDYDSAFDDKTEFSPRLGFAWSINSKTVLRGSWGLFYDHFRLGIARDIPGFGGADLRSIQPLSYPRLFYGVPSIAPALFGLCLNPVLTDAQIAAQGLKCPYPFDPPGTPYFGVDHLNNIVAPGHAPIPGNSVVNLSNVQQLSGLDPTTFINAASTAIAQQPGFLFWGPYGALSFLVNPAGSYPVTVDPRFKTPYTNSFSIGIQRQLANDWEVSVDYYHKSIDDILGIRQTNLPFESRIANDFAGTFVNGFGPWYSGKYDAGILSFQKRMSHRFTLGGSYSYVSENDNAGACSILDSSLRGVCYPTDSFAGVPPVVTDPGNIASNGTCPGGTNATAAFFACNGNYVPVAGKFYNGANLDKGPSDFALRHYFQMHGLIDLPWKFELSLIFRAQSGFRYTESALVPVDQDGNSNFNGRDLKTGRNQFTAPPFVNMDLRVAKTFPIGERVKVQGLFEFFNLFNNANPAAIQNAETTNPLPVGSLAFGSVSQYLPGREGQVGLRITF
jgi:TonB dependent receptor/Carboxypeptidase regulatory-like domain/TonB-dependent Receptor Plug Domain